MASSDAALESLDIRLRRLEYALTGSSIGSESETSEKAGKSIPDQIQSVNERLAKIANQNKNIKKVLQFCRLYLYPTTDNR